MVRIMKIRSLLVLKVMVAALILVAGCAELRGQRVADPVEILTQAGFKKVVATNQEDANKLRKLEQGRLIQYRNDQDDKLYYVYNEVDKCACAYVGTPENYKKFLELAKEAQMEEWERRVIQHNETSTQDWQFWSPYRKGF